MVAFPWYVVTSGDELQQGDFLVDVIEPVPPRTEREAIDTPINATIYTSAIILSQSCDLVAGREKVEHVLVCPVWTLADYIAAARDNPKTVKKMLTEGRLIHYHLLDRCDLEGHRRPHLVVELRGAFSIGLAYARQLVLNTDTRLRLQPPYREHLSQAFARMHMRVGLPIPVSELP